LSPKDADILNRENIKEQLGKSFHESKAAVVKMEDIFWHFAIQAWSKRGETGN
jgi:hypothetical protein